MVYLTARPLRHLQETKRFLAGASEREQLLPAGPLFCNKVGPLFCAHLALLRCNWDMLRMSVCLSV